MIPTRLSLLLIADEIWWQAAVGVAVAVIAVIIHMIARPGPGLSIGVPALVSLLLAATAALVISPPRTGDAGYICGAQGTLAGGDVLILPQVRELGARVASIHCPGTVEGSSSAP